MFKILFYIITLVLFFGFCQNLYNRKNPKVSFSSEIKDYEKTVLSNKNFTLAFRLENADGIQITNNSIAFIQVGFFQYEVQLNGKLALVRGVEDQTLTNRKCSDIAETPQKEKSYNISLSSWYCVDFDNLTLGGYWDGNFIYGFTILTKLCKLKIIKNNNMTVNTDNISNLKQIRL